MIMSLINNKPMLRPIGGAVNVGSGLGVLRKQQYSINIEDY